MKTAVVFGAAGQDGSYLCELLLSENYKVVGVKRRSSYKNDYRLKNCLNEKNFQLIEGDVTDFSSVFSILQNSHPKGNGRLEVYNLAAQSHVGTSFQQPTYTTQSVYLGCLNCLESIRLLPNPRFTKFYQASSSEMFGHSFSYIKDHQRYESDDISLVSEYDRESVFQDEDTPFLPCSPYAVAKLAAHNLVDVYRKSYDMFACSGVLFNHETLTYGTPLIVKNDKDYIDILPIGDIARFHTGVVFNMDGEYQGGEPINPLWVWDSNGWTKIKYVSGYPHKGDKSPRIINSRNSVYCATGSHICIMLDESEVETSNINIGDRVKLIDLPSISNQADSCISLSEAEWLGMLVGDGNINKSIPRFTNKDINLKKKFVSLWQDFVENGTFKYKDSYSGFNGSYIGQVECYGKYKIPDIYTHDISPFGHKNKKVPSCILNGNKDVMEAFLIGYNACDGLKSNRCTYRFKNFKTNSHTLALGLIYLIEQVTQQKYNITVEESFNHGKRQFYYSINLLTDNLSPTEKYNIVKPLLNQNIPMRRIHRETNISRSFIKKVNRGYQPELTRKLQLPSNEVKKIIEIPEYQGWFFDLETESGTFHAGAGCGVVHNSPRRGDNFVTKKITNYIRSLAEELNKTNPKIEKLKLGNLDAVRDWGYAPDYVFAMYLMLQKRSPDDYVIATGKSYSVKDFLSMCFEYINLEPSQAIQDFVDFDQSEIRPCEVNILRGRPAKANKKLEWYAEHDIKFIIEEMIENVE